ncbi:MAG: hypothetical protein HYU77_13820 [Betaproteobacteria bacterium]|nr:hypothetical protein [Betaproteobacteria bacterium]
MADDSALKIAEKSRRIGLTWAEAADDALIAAAAAGSNVFYISATQDMAIEYIEACALWARAYDLAAGEIEEGVFVEDGDKEIKTYKIDFPKSGHRIVALSSRPANLRGKQGVVVIDEAAFAADLAGLIKAAMAMLLWGDRVRIISTHNGEDNPFAELIEQVRAGRRKGRVHRVSFREAVADGLYRRVCLRKGVPWTPDGEAAWVADAYAFYGEDAAEELDVIPSQGGGAYLTMGLIVARMSAEVPIVRRRFSREFNLLPEPTRRLEVDAWCREELAPHLDRLNPQRPHGFGEDFARVGDLTAVTILEEGADLVRRGRLLVELANCPYRQQEQILAFIADRLPRFRAGALDATGNGAALAEFMVDRYGSRIFPVTLNDPFYTEEMPKFRAALEDAALTGIPKDAECRDDLRAIRKVGGVPKLPKAKTQDADGGRLQRHGDYAIALLLANYAMTRAVAPIEWTPAPRRASRWDAPAREDEEHRPPHETTGSPAGAW